MDFDSMKYAELRSLAKDLGLKANMKMDKLLKAIKQHYQQEQNKEEVVQVLEDDGGTEEGAKEDAAPACEEEIFSPAVFVNTRRGKGNGTKRRISDTATDASIPLRAAPVDDELAESGELRETKRRKVCSTEDSEDTQTGTAVSNKGGASKAAKAGNQGGQRKSRPTLKPITPNFKKLHEAHFSKMESIDSYVQRKTKQMDTYRSSVKELKNLADKTKQKQVEGRTEPKATRVSLFSPAPATNRAAEERRRHTMLSAKKASLNKAAGEENAAFRPSVISTRRINVRFSEATHDNEHKKSLVKTPARMSPFVTSSTPLKPTADGGKATNVKTTTFSATKTPGPFVFTGNTSTSTTPGTQKKPKFDLKESLSRPLTYKPHAGKLKPFGETKENTAGNKSLISVDSHQKKYKQHQVQTREGRRAKQVEGRRQKKQNLLGARRGLVMM